MIQLTRLNNCPLVVNSDLIKFVEQAPDTVITLLSGEKIVVRESAQEVCDRVVQFRRAVLQNVAPGWDNCSAIPTIVENKVENTVENNVANAAGNAADNYDQPAGDVDE
jgi:uncharacterized protein YlzI (FlbEa/FlbD family)